MSSLYRMREDNEKFVYVYFKGVGVFRTARWGDGVYGFQELRIGYLEGRCS